MKENAVWEWKMLKKMHRLIGLSLAVLLVAACAEQEKQRTSGGDPLFVSNAVTDNSSRETSVDIAEEQAKRTEREKQIATKVVTFFENLKGMKLSIDTSIQSKDFKFNKHQSNQEQYGAGTVQRYYVETETNVNDTKHVQFFYLEGQEKKDDKPTEKFYARTPSSEWQETVAGRTQPIYLYFAKLLLEGNEAWTITEGVGQPYISKKLETSNLLTMLPESFDFPFVLSPEAVTEATINFQVDEETGLIGAGTIEGIVTDLGETYTYKIQMRTQYDAEFKEVTVDLSQKPEVLEVTPENFLEQFKKVNEANALTFYESHLTDTNYEDTKVQVLYGTYLNGKPHLSILGTIADEKIDKYELLYNGKIYSEHDGKVDVVEYPFINYYANAVEQFTKHYDELILTENPTEEETTTDTYRYQIDDDFDTYVGVAGLIDVTSLKREGSARYAIDFVINRTTLQLEAVYYWSVVPEDEAVQVVKTVGFNNFNGINPNLVKQHISTAIWEALK